MKMMTALRAGAVVAALGFAGQAGATPLTGSVTFDGSTTATDLVSTSSITATNVKVQGTAGDFNGRVALDAQSSSSSISIGPLTTTNPVNFSVSLRSAGSGVLGTFVATSFMRIGTLSGMFTGSFTPAVPSAVDTFDVGSASFRIDLNGSGGFSGTLISPAQGGGGGSSAAVPEPASMALLGFGLLGLGLARRTSPADARRKAN